MFLEFSYDRSQVINALRFHFLHRGEIQVFRVTLVILFFCTAAGNILNVVSLPAVLIIFIMIVGLLLIFWYILPISTYNKSATFRENIHLQVNEEGMSIGTHIGQRQISWSSFSFIVETSDFFYLYRDKKSFFLVPLAAFRNESDKQAFRALLQDRFTNYKITG